MTNLLLWWTWLAVVVFVLSCLWRAMKYARAPEHLRWDLYPVAHEPRRGHGGSHLEEKDWWAKPRKKSHWGELSFMLEEILWLKGVWTNNRKLWFGSLPFHWGLYLLTVTSAGLVAAAFGLTWPLSSGLLTVLGAAGGLLTAVGALILLAIRSGDVRLRPYTTLLDRLNLTLLAVLGGLSAAVALLPPGMTRVSAATDRILHLQPAGGLRSAGRPDGRGRVVHPVLAVHADGALLLQVLHLPRRPLGRPPGEGGKRAGA